MDIINSEVLAERFGQWPAFHDAEIQSLTVDSGQRRDGIATMRLEIHQPWRDGHYLVTLEFAKVIDLDLDAEFLSQNVIFELSFGDDDLVELIAGAGLGGNWRAQSVRVVSVEPFEPGPHSVYHTH